MDNIRTIIEAQFYNLSFHEYFRSIIEAQATYKVAFHVKRLSEKSPKALILLDKL